MRDKGRVSAQLTPVRPVSAVAGLTLKAAFLLGFVVTVGLWLYAGYRLTQRLTGLDAQTAAINARFIRAQDLLSTTRAQVLLGSVFVHDALLDPDASAGD